MLAVACPPFPGKNKTLINLLQFYLLSSCPHIKCLHFRLVDLGVGDRNDVHRVGEVQFLRQGV